MTSGQGQGGMRSAWAGLCGVAVAACICPAVTQAQEVQATFSLPPEHAATPVSWSATPTDLPEGADVLSAMVMQPDSAPGPWTVALAPGAYQITAFSEADVFELTLLLPEAPAVQAYEVPPLALSTSVPFRCEGDTPCTFADAATGLAFALPPGWAAEAPYFAEQGDGELAAQVSAVFFEEGEGEDVSVWFLNPPDWTEEEFGPCRPVSAGALCTFDPTEGAEAAFAVIAPALNASAAVPAPVPAPVPAAP